MNIAGYAKMHIKLTNLIRECVTCVKPMYYFVIAYVVVKVKKPNPGSRQQETERCVSLQEMECVTCDNLTHDQVHLSAAGINGRSKISH